ncbi:MAG: glycosyltransferase family 2 protein [Flavobacteriaceae bacterium]|nr:glycosyltransferase family 2 protein [Flavobacteriaceae bacterium]
MGSIEKELSIIIVNYNGKHYLKDCIDSIILHCSSVSYEIIIIDNNSSDGSQEYLQTTYPEITLISKTENVGFGKANNIGIQHSSGENILLLNNDTILLQNISPIIEIVKREDVGAVGVKMLNGKKEFTPSYGKFPTPLSLLKLSNLNETRSDFVTGDFKEKEYKVDWISGAFMMMKRQDWDFVGGFDEDFFMYVEDVDLCKRLKNHKKQIIFYSKYSYIHFVGFNSKRELKLINGYKLYSAKHFNFVNAILAKTCLNINYAYKRAFKNIR